MASADSGFRSLFQLKKEKVTREEEHLLLGFSVGDQSYAVPIPAVQEILRVPHLFSMPKVPAFIKGVMDLRGVLLPVLDLKERLDLGAVDRKQGRVVVVSAGKCLLGILVDKVWEVFSVPAAQIKPPPEMLHQPHTAFIEGMVRSGEHLYLVLNPERVLTQKELRTLESQGWEDAGPGAAGQR